MHSAGSLSTAFLISHIPPMPCPRWHKKSHCDVECLHVPSSMGATSPDGSSPELLDLAVGNWGGLGIFDLTTSISHWEPEVDITVSAWSFSILLDIGSAYLVLMKFYKPPIFLFPYHEGRVAILLASPNPNKDITQAQYALSLHSFQGLKSFISDFLREFFLYPMGCLPHGHILCKALQVLTTSVILLTKTFALVQLLFPLPTLTTSLSLFTGYLYVAPCFV